VVSNVGIQIDGEGRCRLPIVFQHFVEAFDTGRYPDLIDTLPKKETAHE
jgi:hypothetical protein